MDQPDPTKTESEEPGVHEEPEAANGAADEQSAAESAHSMFRFGLLGWKVLTELPNPINFEAATEMIEPADVAETFACGPDAERHVEVFEQFADAGFDHLALVNAGPDPDGFFEFFARELSEPLRKLG